MEYQNINVNHQESSKDSTGVKKAKKTKKDEGTTPSKKPSPPLLPPKAVQVEQMRTIQSYIDSMQSALRGVKDQSSLSSASYSAASSNHQLQYYPEHHHPHHHVHFPATADTITGKPPLYPSSSDRPHTSPLHLANTHARATTLQETHRALNRQHEHERSPSAYTASSSTVQSKGNTSSRSASVQKGNKRGDSSTKKTASKSKEKRSSSAPPGTRYMYRAKPSPHSTFGKSERWNDL